MKSITKYSDDEDGTRVLADPLLERLGEDGRISEGSTPSEIIEATMGAVE